MISYFSNIFAEFTVIRKKVDSVDITFMTGESLNAFSVSEIPELCACVTRSTNEGSFIITQTDTHNIALVSHETCCLLT